MKRPLIAIAAVILLLIILVVRTLSFHSRQPVVRAVPVQMDDSLAEAQRLAAAVRIATISREGVATDTVLFDSLARFYASAFPRTHAALTREMAAGRTLLYTWRGSDTSLAPIMLIAHQDVVPADTGAGAHWTHAPFAGDIADGYVWGRGALDDKIGVLGELEAVEHLLARGWSPRRTVLLGFGHDEEISGHGGAEQLAALLKSRGVHPLFLLDEGGQITDRIVPGVTAPVALVGIAEKGYASISLTVRSDGGHSSMPPHATAIGILSHAIDRLERHPFPGRLTGGSAALFAWVGPEMSFGMRLAFANEWLFAPIIRAQLSRGTATDAAIRTTTAPTIIRAGNKDNVLPSEARAVVNFRILPGDDVQTVLTHVKHVVDDDRVEIQLEGKGDEPSPVSAADGPEFALIARTIREIFPAAVVAPYLTLGATDARHYSVITSQLFRFNPLTVGKGDLDRIHGLDERARVADLPRAEAFYERLIVNAAGDSSALR